MSAEPTPTTNRRPNYLFAAAPLLWAVLILFHPMPGGDSTLDGIDDVVDRWLIVHVGQLILTPLLFLAVWRLLDGLTSTAATISRCALVVWTVFFSAYDAVQGIATGLLVRHADGVPRSATKRHRRSPRLPRPRQPPRRRHLRDPNGGRRSLADRRHRRRHRPPPSSGRHRHRRPHRRLSRVLDAHGPRRDRTARPHRAPSSLRERQRAGTPAVSSPTAGPEHTARLAQSPRRVQSTSTPDSEKFRRPAAKASSIGPGTGLRPQACRHSAR